MEIDRADRLNILGAEITFLGDGLAVLAAKKEAEQKQEKNEVIKKQLDEEATQLNKFANWIVFFGDFISALAAELDAKENIQEIKSDSTKLEATKLNLISTWLMVIADALAVEAQALEESSNKDTTAQ